MDNKRKIIKVMCGCNRLAFLVGQQEGNEVVEYVESPYIGLCQECDARGGDYNLKKIHPPMERPLPKTRDQKSAKVPKSRPAIDPIRDQVREADRSNRRANKRGLPPPAEVDDDLPADSGPGRVLLFVGRNREAESGFDSNQMDQTGRRRRSGG